MKAINVSILMSHDTGIVQHYYKPQEQDLLRDYMKAIPSLTIEFDKVQLNKQIQTLEENNKTNEYIINGKLLEKDQEIKNVKGELDIIKQQMKSILSIVQTLNSDDEKELLAKKMISQGIYDASN
jgi:hypothetical protein